MIQIDASRPDQPQPDSTGFRDRASFLETLWASYLSAQMLENLHAADLAASNRPYPKRYTNTREQFFAAALPLAEGYHTDIIAGGAPARDATLMFLYGMRKFMGRRDDNQLPIDWLGVFERAYEAGDICSMAWGATIRAIYTSCGPHPLDLGRNHNRYLELMRSVPRKSVMTGDEMAHYNALPETVTLYRGSVTPTDIDGAKGISWTLSQRDARYFAGVRESVAYCMVEPGAMRQMGRTRIVAATVPKALIFGCVSFCLDGVEFLVDWERIKPEMISSLAHEPAPGQIDVVRKMLGDINRRLIGR